METWINKYVYLFFFQCLKGHWAAHWKLHKNISVYQAVAINGAKSAELVLRKQRQAGRWAKLRMTAVASEAKAERAEQSSIAQAEK